MTMRLDSPVRVGSTVLAVLSRQTILRHNRGGCLVLACQKHPVAVLIMDKGQIIALGPSGQPMTEAEVTGLCPGALEQFRAAATN